MLRKLRVTQKNGFVLKIFNGLIQNHRKNPETLHMTKLAAKISKI